MHDLLLKLWGILHLPTNIQLYLMRFVNDQFLIGATGIFLNGKDEILLVKHTYRNRNRWSLPGGYIKSREHPKEGLEREVQEETGMVVSADERLKIRTDRDFARLDITYKGTFIGGEFKRSKEVSEAQFFPFHELPLLAKDQLLFIEEVINQKNFINTSKSS